MFKRGDIVEVKLDDDEICIGVVKGMYYGVQLEINWISAPRNRYYGHGYGDMFISSEDCTLITYCDGITTPQDPPQS
jgi:hypothetical protein